MTQLVILVVEDEPEVRAAIVRDLEPLVGVIRLDEADTADDALTALAECTDAGDTVGLVLADHRLPGRSGVDLLVALQGDPATRTIRKVLVTGQAGHDDTIRAINDAGLAHYIAKPWDPADLRSIVVEQLTDFVLDAGLDPLTYVQVLDGPRLLDEYSRARRPD